MWKDTRGFTLIEIVVATFFLSMIILVVGSLGQQVSRFSNSTRQSGAVIELRTKANSLSKNITTWLDRLRSSPFTKGIFAGCLPDPSANTSIFSCPPIDADLLTNDPELKKIAGSSLFASSVPIVDNMGEKIAGSLDDPLYLDNDGRTCSNPNPSRSCPLKGTGYLLRSSSGTSDTPGSVKLVVKIERNGTSTTANNSGPMRPHYINVDVGTQWNSMSNACPKGAIKIGYLSNGNPQCINPTASCASGEIAMGLNPDGTPICKTVPATCPNQSMALDMSGNLVCTESSPCAVKQIFLGYFSGTGEAMCSSPDVRCSPGEVQVGLAVNSTGSLTAECAKLPSCSESEKLSYDGSKFVCQSASLSKDCLGTEIVVGINSDGSPKCSKFNREPVTLGDCASDEVVYGIDSAGKVKCRKLPDAPDPEIKFPGVTCPPGQALGGIDQDLNPVCFQVNPGAPMGYEIKRAVWNSIIGNISCDPNYNASLKEATASIGWVIDPRNYISQPTYNTIKVIIPLGGRTTSGTRPKWIDATVSCTPK